MSLTTNSIDSFSFIALKGDIEPPKQALQTDQRLGVDGTEFTETGTRGKPFQLRSQVDCNDYQSAISTFDTYYALIGNDPVTVIQAGISSADRGFKCQVMDVKLVNAQTIVSVGGSGGNGWLDCQWTLLSVATEED